MENGINSIFPAINKYLNLNGYGKKEDKNKDNIQELGDWEIYPEKIC